MTDSSFEYRLVCPELPATDAWLPYLQPAVEANWYTNYGPVCRQFEQAVAAKYGGATSVCVSATSATSGLAACLIAHRIRGPVICPAFTFPATASAILTAGCDPVIQDVAADSMTIDPAELDAALAATGASAAIVVAPYGLDRDFTAHVAVCQQHGARLIIDNAAGLGVPRRQLEAARHVDEVYSLHATKPFNIGEGGMIFSHRDHELALRSSMNFGLNTHTADGADHAPYWGVNGKLTEVHAAIGLAVLEQMDARVIARQAMATRWHEALVEFHDLDWHSDPSLGPWQVFPVVLPDGATAERFVRAAADLSVELRRYYAPSLGDCPGMRRVAPCPVASNLATRVVTLPVRSTLPVESQGDLIERCRRALERALNRTS